MSDVQDKAKWERAKRDALKAMNTDKWDARVAQKAVKLYKSRGGLYNTRSKSSSLGKWSCEKWRYSSPEWRNKGRYLPDGVWTLLTPSQILATNHNKEQGRKEGRRNVPWEPYVKDAMKKYKKSSKC